MDPVSLLNPTSLALGTAAALPLFLLAIPRLNNSPAWHILRPTLLPLALTAAFLTCFTTQFDLPHSHDNIPWYLDEVWKLIPIAALLIGIAVSLAQILKRPVAGTLLLLLTAALVLLLVRGPWLATADHAAWHTSEDRPELLAWPTFAAALAFLLPAYLISLTPLGRGQNQKLWPLAAIVLWASSSAAALITLTWIDNRLGKLLVMLAILAGLSGTAGLIRPLRPLLRGAWQFLALTFASLWLLLLFYNNRADPSPVPLSSLLLLAAAPLSTALAWLPPLQKRPLLCTILATTLTAALLVPALLIAQKFAPPMSE